MFIRDTTQTSSVSPTSSSSSSSSFDSTAPYFSSTSDTSNSDFSPVNSNPSSSMSPSTPQPSGGGTEPQNKGLSDGAIAGIVIGSVAVVAILVIVAVIVYKRYRPASNPKIPDIPMYPAYQDNQTSTSYMNNADLEFNILRNHSSTRPTIDGNLPHNQTKNRYHNIVPYDFNRVQLKSGNYINASIIERGAGTTFIATQDPIPTEDGDFWPMVWEQDVRVIIRLSSDKDFSDSGKQARCAVYLPDRLWVVTPELEVDNQGSQSTRDYIRTKLQLTELPMRNKSYTVIHYLINDWSQATCPEPETRTIETIEKIIDDLKRNTVSSSDKVLVHCGAGTGRTGTFIAIWQIKELTSYGQPVEVLDLCMKLRDQRPQMITQKEQFQYVIRCYNQLVSDAV